VLHGHPAARWPDREDGLPDESPVEPTDDPPDEPPGTSPPGTSPGGSGDGPGRVAVRTFGEVLITLGLVVLLFVVYELYVTNLMSAQLQREADAQLDRRWSDGPEREVDAGADGGAAFARLYIPSFGADWSFTVQEGVDDATLEIGPGHYRDSASPGQPGNFAVAGHRVGKGAPFNDLDQLESCDPVVIETAEHFFVYRVLPMRDEVAGWASGRGSDPRCADVAPPERHHEEYADTVGRRIVLPSRGDAVAPVPYRPAGAVPEEARAALLTLTTCHPQFSDRERMIIHSELTHRYEKRPGAGYEELLAEIGEI
ncbi:class E sortase, partial [Saccharomonospora iraqiensis]|uniref:class E sortase n=1 Tax=Saccharomonospora iraqiensis TaxID=52698 RepID=UPI002D21A3A4